MKPFRGRFAARGSEPVQALRLNPRPLTYRTMAEPKQPASAAPKPGAAMQRSEPTYPDHSSTWDGRRRAKVPSDKAMTGSTLDWVISLPAHLRPKQLCDRLPRVANSLAAVWKDRTACLAMLAGFQADSRASRRGFPVVLREEIQRLFEYRDKQG